MFTSFQSSLFLIQINVQQIKTTYKIRFNSISGSCLPLILLHYICCLKIKRQGTVHWRSVLEIFNLYYCAFIQCYKMNIF